MYNVLLYNIIITICIKNDYIQNDFALILFLPAVFNWVSLCLVDFKLCFPCCPVLKVGPCVYCSFQLVCPYNVVFVLVLVVVSPSVAPGCRWVQVVFWSLSLFWFW